MTTGQRIREHYLNEGFSRRGYADKLGTNEAAIRRLEAGENVHPATAKKVADDMGLKVTDLLPLEPAA